MVRKRTVSLAAALAALVIPLELPAQSSAPRATDPVTPEVITLTLGEAQSIALKDNPRLRAARTSVRLPEADLAQARRFSNPVLLFGASPGLNAGTGVSLSLAKRFEVAGQRGLRGDAARTRIEAAQWEVSDVERVLRMQVAQAFYAVRVGQETVEVLDSVVAVTGRLLEAAELKLQQGFAPALDRNLARIQLMLAQVERESASRELLGRKAELNALIGRPPKDEVAVSGPLIHGPVPREMSLEQLGRYAARMRPDAQVVAQRSRAASLNANLARRLAFPDLFLGFGFDRDADGLQTVRLNAGVSLPLFDRNQQGQDLARAEQALVAAEGEARSLAISQEVRSAFARLEAARIGLEAYQDHILALADSSQRFASTAYARGELDVTTALLAQRQYTDAQVTYLDAALEFDWAALELEGAVGAPLDKIIVATPEEDGA